MKFSKYFLWNPQTGQNFLRTRFTGSRSLSSSAEDCTGFYDCIPVNGEWEIVPGHRPDGLVFDPVIKACNFPDVVDLAVCKLA